MPIQASLAATVGDRPVAPVGSGGLEWPRSCSTWNARILKEYAQMHVQLWLMSVDQFIF